MLSGAPRALPDGEKTAISAATYRSHIRPRIESGPLGTRSFLLPEAAPRTKTAPANRPVRPRFGPTLARRPNSDRPKAKFDPGYDRSDDRFRGHRSACRAAPRGRAGRG